MNGDFSRVTFDPLKHYLRVVMQQGRVQLDADWNEQVAILLHFLQTLAADLIGQHGGPIDLTDAGMIIRRNLGLEIITRGEQLDKVSDDDERDHWKGRLGQINPKILISKGRYYVDGRLCELENYLPYSDQPGYPWLNEQGNEEEFADLGPGRYLVYLDVWERYVTSLEDPEIREVALGGADTAARSKLVCQVKIKTPKLDGTNMTCGDFPWDEHLGQLNPRNRGKLKARAKEDDNPGHDEPCVTAPDARFLGVENQLYRVEIHRGGSAWNGGNPGNASNAATFKWSRDNGSIVAAYKAVNGNDLIVSGLRDNSRWFSAGQWVELTHDDLELKGEPGTIVKLAKVDGETLTIDPDPANRHGDIFAPTNLKNPKVKRWDHKGTKDTKLNEGAVLIREGDGDKSWIELEDGVRIQFQKPKTGNPSVTYRTGDYWLIPARVATGDVEWPGEVNAPVPVAPHGVEHHYAPLAIIELTASGTIVTSSDPIDLRHKFLTLAECDP